MQTVIDLIEGQVSTAIILADRTDLDETHEGKAVRAAWAEMLQELTRAREAVWRTQAAFRAEGSHG